jgi:BNR repeat-containing family member
LPLNAANAEYACHIPQNSELINQTSMAADDFGNPFIATYWRSDSSDIPQYHVVYNASNKWKEINSGFRKTPFSLKGQGTKRTPIARPQIVVKGKGDKAEVQLFFRDSERNDVVSMAVCDIISTNNWKLFDLTNESVGAWEPSFDTELWNNKKRIHLYVQKVDQKDSEGVVKSMPTMVNVLEIQPSSKTSSL